MNELVTTIPAIIVITYLVGMGCKAAEQIPDKFIPVIVGSVGAALGVVGMYTIKDFPATDVLNALAIGIASGLASTGANQIIKQLRQDDLVDEPIDDGYYIVEDDEEDSEDE